MPDNLAPDQAIVGVDVPDHPLSQDEYLINNLASQGYDPRDLAAFKHGGGNLVALLPKPQTIQDQDYKDRMRAAGLARADKTLNPAARPQPKPRQRIDPVTGEITLEEYDPSTGDFNSRPKMLSQYPDVAAYQPKEKAWQGKTDEGAPWTMKRRDTGEAYDYQEGAAPKPVVKEITRQDGSKIKVIEKVNTDGSIAYTEAPTTLNGEAYSKENFPKTKPGTTKYPYTQSKQIWNPDTGKYDEVFTPEPAVITQKKILERPLIGALSERKRLEEKLRSNDPEVNFSENSYWRDLTKKAQKAQATLDTFKSDVKKKAHPAAYEKIFGYDMQDLPDGSNPQAEQNQPVTEASNEVIPPAAMNPRYRDLNTVSGITQLSPPQSPQAANLQAKPLAPNLSPNHNSILQDYKSGKIDYATTLKMLRALDKQPVALSQENPEQNQ